MTSPLKAKDCSPVLEWMMEKQPKREWLINGYIPAGCIGFLQADGGVGKSNLANLMALTIATGKTHGPFVPEKPNKVLILNVEDLERDIALRVHVLGNTYQIGTVEYNLIQQNFMIYPGAMSIGPLMCLDNNKPVPTEHLDWLEKSITNLCPALVILDTKSRLFGLDENSNSHNSIWLQQLNRISHKTGCGFLIIHHHNKKNGKDGRDSLSADSGRGASSQGADSRYVISGAGITMAEAKKYNMWPIDDYFKITTSKMNYGRKMGIEYFVKKDEGIPVHVVPTNNKAAKIAEDLVAWLVKMESCGTQITKRSMARFDTPETKEFKKEIEEKYYGKAPRGVNSDIEIALKILEDDGRLETSASGRGNTITVRGGDEDF